MRSYVTGVRNVQQSKRGRTNLPVRVGAKNSLKRLDCAAYAAVDGEIEHGVINAVRQFVAAHGIPIPFAVQRLHVIRGQRLDVGLGHGVADERLPHRFGAAEVRGAARISRGQIQRGQMRLPGLARGVQARVARRRLR